MAPRRLVVCGTLALMTTNTCTVALPDRISLTKITGRCHDGSHGSMVSPRVTMWAMLEGICRMEAIKPVMVQVALRQRETAQTFIFSCS